VEIAVLKVMSGFVSIRSAVKGTIQALEASFGWRCAEVKMKQLILFLLVLLATSCIPASPATVDPTALPPDTAVTNPPVDNVSTNEPFEDPFSPKPGDSKFTRGNVFISESGLVIRESYPPQISLQLSGDLPTPCHRLRVKINEPDIENNINAEAYSIVDSDRACIQVLETFEADIDLGTFPAGHYTVWVNEEMIGEFDS
jgi:hypothetical protein